MPNWIKNKILVGSVEASNELLSEVISTNEGNDYLDFDKIIPMPKELEIEFSSRADLGLKLACEGLDPEQVKEIKDLEGSMELIDWEKEKLSRLQKGMGVGDTEAQEEYSAILELGERQASNIIKYGHKNWYTWHIQNWGTKWNSSKLELSNSTIKFETAWDPAIPVVIELSKKHPEIKIAYLWADESIGSYAGYMLMKGGHIDYKGTFPDYSVDAYKLAFDLWDCADEFEFDEEKQTYRWKD